MSTDPRCPRCNGKVSARAAWCMHCGADFETAGSSHRSVDRDSAESDLARFVRAFDRNDGTRQVLTIVVTIVALFPLLLFGTPTPGSVPLALLGAVALAAYLRFCGSARRIVVHGAYGTAALIASLRLAAGPIGGFAQLSWVLLDDGALLVVALLVGAGWRIDGHVAERG